jgi:hypothetical protein
MQLKPNIKVLSLNARNKAAQRYGNVSTNQKLQSIIDKKFKISGT